MACSSSPGFGWVLLCCCFSFICALTERSNGLVEASRRIFHNTDTTEESSLSSVASKQYRTAYHFQPPQHWMNDPNGPMYYNGVYHLFYQYNPYASVWVWGSISWGHSVSMDLINWTPLDLALSPTDPFDVNGCWSGSATILPGNKPVILYTGIDTENRQVQNIAFPANRSDPFLRKWIKPNYNPLMAPVDGLDSGQFRDPTTGWLGADGLWRVAVGAEIQLKGRAMLYRSKDFVHWVRAQGPLASTNGSGMWECPDFYPVGVKGREKHVMKMSLIETRSDHYMLGSYDEKNDAFVRDDSSDDYRKWSRYDYGEFYASKTFFDAEKQQRILWGWSNESDSQSDDVAKGWSGIQIIPRVVSLDSNGRQLVQWPIKELASLRRNKVQLQDVELKSGGLLEIKGLKASMQADVEVEFELAGLEKAEPFDPAWMLDPPVLCGEKGASVPGGIGPFGLLVLASQNLEEHMAVFFRVFRAHNRYVTLICSDQRRSSLRKELYKPAYGSFVDIDIEKDGKISLRTLIDHSVVESFGGGGRAVITSRVYPTVLLSGKTHLYAFNNGSVAARISELKAWDMAKPRINEED